MKMKLIIIFICTVFILLLIGGFLVYQRQTPSSSPPPPSSLKLYSLAPDQKTLTPPKTIFKAAEQVTFVLAFEKKPFSFWPFVKKAFAQETTQNITTQLLYNNEEAKDITVQMHPLEENKLSFSLLQKDPNQFKPGQYQFKITREAGEQTQEITQDFAWGVLAINTNKSIYTPGEKVYLQMASLDQNGRTLCNSDLKLWVTDPAGQVQTPDIKHSQSCGNDNVTDNPDYFSYYLLTQAGTYHLKLTNNSNKYSIDDSFEVKESVPFSVERIGATRINPFKSEYTMNIKVTANQDFEGEVVEQVPEGFEIKNSNIENSFKIKNLKLKIIEWGVSLKKNETITLSYTYQAPKISPEIFLLGPVSLTSGVGPDSPEVFREARQWQIAADPVATIFMETPDATNATTGNTGTEFWTSVTGTVTYDTTQKKSGNGSWKAVTPSDLAYLRKSGILADAGRRISVYFRFTGFSTLQKGIIKVYDSAGTTIVWELNVTLDGILRLSNGTFAIGAGSTLSTGVWYRITVDYTITSTSVNEFRVFLNGVQDIKVSNATLNASGSNTLDVGWENAVGFSIALNFQHVYVDNGTDLGDPGDIRVTAKLPNAWVHTNWDGTPAIGNIDDRPINTATFETETGTTALHQDADIQSMSAGDVDIFGNTIVALNSWVYAADGAGANGTPQQIYFNGTSGDQESAVSLTTTPTLFQKIVDTPNYPGPGIAAVGMESTGAGADTIFYEGGVLVAYKVQPPIMQFSGIKMQGIKVN